LPKAFRGERQPDLVAGKVNSDVDAKQSPFAKLAALKKPR
jgi:hypothetical protein